jgi:hypothetical protein
MGYIYSYALHLQKKGYDLNFIELSTTLLKGGAVPLRLDFYIATKKCLLGMAACGDCQPMERFESYQPFLFPKPMTTYLLGIPNLFHAVIESYNLNPY